MTITDKYILFYGHDWPSNFARSPIREVDKYSELNMFGRFPPYTTFQTAEAYYQSRKALVANDKNSYYKIAQAKTPGETKKLARKINLKSREWDSVRVSWMVDTLKKKFDQNPELKAKLLDPALDGKIFVEASPIDTFWGIGKSEEACVSEIKQTGRLETFDFTHDVPYGFNVLGELLNNLRDELKKQK